MVYSSFLRGRASEQHLFDACQEWPRAEAVVQVGEEVLPNEVCGLFCGEEVLEGPDMRAWEL